MSVSEWAEGSLLRSLSDQIALLSQSTETQAKLDKEEVAKVTEELLAETEALKVLRLTSLRYLIYVPCSSKVPSFSRRVPRPCVDWLLSGAFPVHRGS